MHAQAKRSFRACSRVWQLSAKIKAYCKEAEGLEPSLEDHPQVRRMARYLLENVEWETLEAPLSPELLQMKGKSSSASRTGGTVVAGLPRHVLYGGLVFAVLLICVVLFVMLGGGGGGAAAAKPAHEHVMSHPHASGRGGRAGRGWRNGSEDAP